MAEEGVTECCAATYNSAYGTMQFSITQRTRSNFKYFEAEWLPTQCRAKFATKREATAWVKDHEKRAGIRR